MQRKGWAVAAAAILLILGAIGIAWLNPQLTHYLESDRFRAKLEKETAKGLHFPAGHYAPIHRKGFLAAAADRFQADNGRKALRAIDARGTVRPRCAWMAAVSSNYRFWKTWRRSRRRALERLTLNDCSFALEWDYPRAEIKNIAIEEKGKFRAEGRIQVEKKELSGAIELGVARYLLDWLPKREEVFPHQRDGYLWTTVHLSGTIDAPQQDLSQRIMEVLKENPGAALGLLLGQLASG